MFYILYYLEHVGKKDAICLRIVVSNSLNRPVPIKIVTAYFCRHGHLNHYEETLIKQQLTESTHSPKIY